MKNSIFKTTLVPAFLMLALPAYAADPATELATAIGQGSSEFVRALNGNAKRTVVQNSNLFADVSVRNADIGESADVIVGMSITGETTEILNSNITSIVDADNLTVREDAKFRAGIIVGGK